MAKVAALQMCSSHLVSENLAMAAKLIAEAKANSAELVVLPEMFAAMGLKEQDKLKIKEKYGDGLIQNFLAEQALKNNIWIVAGTIPISTQTENKARASCLIYNNQGVVVARYDKIHLFDVTLSARESYFESSTIEAGNNIVVLDTPIGKLGIAVCYDIRFPRLFAGLHELGAEIIAIPAAFTMKTGAAHWELLARARAVENFCYVIGACQGGTHTSQRQTYGHSLIVDPWGKIMTELNESKPGVIYADIDLKYLADIRKSIPLHPKL